MDAKLMSERYRKSLSWPEQRDKQVTSADKACFTRAIYKHKGMRRAVKHLQEQLLLHTTLWLQSATALANKQQLHEQAVQRAE